MKKAISNVVLKLKHMLEWSDRIGSDEIYEIHDIINLLEKETK